MVSKKIIQFQGAYYELQKMDYARETLLFKEVEPDLVQFVVPCHGEPGLFKYDPEEPWLQAYHIRQNRQK